MLIKFTYSNCILYGVLTKFELLLLLLLLKLKLQNELGKYIFVNTFKRIACYFGILFVFALFFFGVCSQQLYIVGNLILLPLNISYLFLRLKIFSKNYLNVVTQLLNIFFKKTKEKNTLFWCTVVASANLFGVCVFLVENINEKFQKHSTSVETDDLIHHELSLIYI